MRSVLLKLEGLRATRAKEVEQLETTNEALRARWATLRLSARLMLEMQRHHQITAGFADANDAQILRLQAILSSAGAGGLGPSSPGATTSLNGAASAGGGAAKSGTGAAGASGAADGLGALANFLRPAPGIRAEQGPGGMAARGGSAGSVGSIGAMDGGDGLESQLLRHLPHLGPGKNLLRLDGVGQDQVDEVRRLSLREAKQRWAAMIREGLELLERAERERQREPRRQPGPSSSSEPAPSGTGAGGPGSSSGGGDEPEWPSGARGALASVASRMDTFMGLLCLYNQEVFVAFMASRTDREDGMFAEDDRPTLAAAAAAAANAATAAAASPARRGGRHEAVADAPEGLWEMVVGAALPSRSQALLVVQFSENYVARLSDLRARRKRLLERLAQCTAAAAPGRGGGMSAVQAELARAAALEDVDANIRAERLAIVLAGQAMRVICTPMQLLKMWCAAYPWPMHQLSCAAVLKSRLRDTSKPLPDAPAD